MRTFSERIQRSFAVWVWFFRSIFVPLAIAVGSNASVSVCGRAGRQAAGGVAGRTLAKKKMNSCVRTRAHASLCHCRLRRSASFYFIFPPLLRHCLINGVRVASVPCLVSPFVLHFVIMVFNSLVRNFSTSYFFLVGHFLLHVRTASCLHERECN